jgi:hypothetical protein
MCAGEQALNHAPGSMRAQHERLIASAPVEHAVGKYVPAIEVGSKLHLIDGQKGDVEVARHGLDGRDPIARVGGLDLLLAGDQRHGLRANSRADFVVNLARQEPQRQSDDAGRVAQHALDGEVRLARIGGAEDSGYASPTAAGVASASGVKGKRH